MLIPALGALALGAVAGIFLAFRHFVRKPLPIWVALAHGVGGATGFTLVLLTVVQQPAFVLARQALYLLIVTIVLGVVNLLFHVRKVRHRTSLIIMHALCAVSGVLTIIYALATGASEPAAVAATATAPPEPPPAAPVESAAPPAETASVVASAPAAPAESAAPAASAAPAPAAPGEFSVPPDVRAALGNTFVFGSNSSLLSSDATPGLTAIATALKAHPEVTLIEVQGHADGRGGDGHNVSLTRSRATAVMEALIALGVERPRLRAAGYGSRCPLDPACGGAAAPESCLEASKLQADRRVVFVPLRVGSASFSGEVACERGKDLTPP